MSQTNLHPMLNIAVKAARAAGSIISRASMDVDRLTVTSKGSNDFVTEVDQAAEQAVIDTLLQAYPGHGILAEESGREFGAQHSDFVWIIDPLDGTTNFIHGLPQYAVSIALAHKGKVEQAVVYDPTRNDLFYATKGRGAFLNDRRLRVSKRTRLLDCLIGTGFPFRKGDNFKRYLKMFEEVMQSCAGVRRPGAAALDLCYVAAGWYDGFFETGLSPWDVAAGSLIITEAGGLVGNFTGEADFMNQREILAGNPKIYAQLVQMLSPYSRVITPGEHAEAPGADAAVTALAQAVAAPPAAAKKAVRVTRAGIAAAAAAAEPAAAATAQPGAAADSADAVDSAAAVPAAIDPFLDADLGSPPDDLDTPPAATSAKAWIAEIPLSPAQALAAAFEPTPAADAPAPVVVRKATRIRKEDLPVVEAPQEAPRARARPADGEAPRGIRSTHRDERDGRDGRDSRPPRDDRPARDSRAPGGAPRSGAGRPAGKFAGKPPAKRGPR